MNRMIVVSDHHLQIITDALKYYEAALTIKALEVKPIGDSKTHTEQNEIYLEYVEKAEVLRRTASDFNSVYTGIPMKDVVDLSMKKEIP